jgi:hypothetical protein
MAISLNDRDLLELDLHSPMLDEFMRSTQLRAVVHAVASAIRAGYVSRAPMDTGDLKASARVSMHRSREFRDRRWEAEFTVGNSRVDYAPALEERYHILAETLRALGYGDVEV